MNRGSIDGTGSRRSMADDMRQLSIAGAKKQIGERDSPTGSFSRGSSGPRDVESSRSSASRMSMETSAARRSASKLESTKADGSDASPFAGKSLAPNAKYSKKVLYSELYICHACYAFKWMLNMQFIYGTYLH